VLEGRNNCSALMEHLQPKFRHLGGLRMPSRTDSQHWQLWRTKYPAMQTFVELNSRDPSRIRETCSAARLIDVHAEVCTRIMADTDNQIERGGGQLGELGGRFFRFYLIDGLPYKNWHSKCWPRCPQQVPNDEGRWSRPLVNLGAFK
jgi:hypothetical protein